MATITVPGIGPVRREYIVAAVAVVAGIVGYAWWARAPIGEPTPPADPAFDAFASDAAGGVVSGTGGGYTITAPDPATLPPRTNAEWATRAVDRLADIGYEAGHVALVLGKYLGRLDLTTAEADIARTAIAMLGPPPVGEYTVKTASAPPQIPRRWTSPYSAPTVIAPVRRG